MEDSETAATIATDPNAARPLRELKHDRGQLTCRFDPSGRYVFSGGQEADVWRWDLETDQIIPLSGHESWVQAMAVADAPAAGAEPLLVTGDYVGRVILWSQIADAQPQPRLKIQAHEGWVRSVAISPDARLVATCGNDATVRLWSVEDGRKLHEFGNHGCHVYGVRFHPAGTSLASADLKGIVREWRLEDGQQAREMDAGALWTYSDKYEVDCGGVRGMQFSPDGSVLACAGSTGDKGIAHSGNALVVLIDWATGRTLMQLAPDKEVIATAWGVVFHPEGYIIGSGGSRTGGALWFWRPDHASSFHTLAFKTRGPGFDLALHPDGRTLAVAHFDGPLRIYDLKPST